MAATLAKRYFFKLLANLVSVPVYLVMEAVLPRALGPQMYGNYSFSTNLFLQFSGFLDMGSSTCFYNYLSRNCGEISLVAFYLRIMFLVAAALGLMGLLVLWQPLGSFVLPDVPLWMAPLAALWAMLTWSGRVLRSANDAIGATISSEIWRAILSILGVIVLLALFLASSLNLHTLFLQQYLLLGATAIAFWLVSKKYWRSEKLDFSFDLTKQQKKDYIHNFFNYSHPLFIQALLSFLMLSAERWLLQWFDGSVQQGFFALSQKVGMACFLFVSAMTPLLMRELSVAWGQKNLEAMGSLLTRFAPALYAIAAYFSCFTMVESAAMVDIFGGKEFAAAVLPVQIMALYPLHQAYGQMATSVFHASGKTHVLRNLTAAECVYGMLATWFLIAPAQYGGLNLGAAGLAIKTVCVQFFTVNLCLWLASRNIPFNFWKNFAHQIWSLALMASLAYISKSLSEQMDLLANYPIGRFFASGIIYSGIIAITTMLAPALLGLNRKDARELSRRFMNSFHKTCVKKGD